MVYHICLDKLAGPWVLSVSLPCLQVPGATSYMGCVGDDEFAQEMTKTAGKDGVNVSSWGTRQLGS